MPGDPKICPANLIFSLVCAINSKAFVYSALKTAHERKSQTEESFMRILYAPRKSF